MKHTKGQWIADGNAVEEFNNEFDICITSNSVSHTLPSPSEETEANAILIASSPIMLEALIEISRIVATGVNISSCQTIAMNAIKKATL